MKSKLIELMLDSDGELDIELEFESNQLETNHVDFDHDDSNEQTQIGYSYQDSYAVVADSSDYSDPSTTGNQWSNPLIL